MKHLKFEHIERNNTYKITNRKKEYLGYLEYYKSWKCWVLNPMYDCIFSVDCMQEIVDFIINDIMVFSLRRKTYKVKGVGKNGSI